jgi:beta-galactosidase
VYPLPLNDLSNLKFTSNVAKENHPYLHRGNLHINEAADTFIDMSGWTKGVVFVNKHNLGRYWKIGPQQTLYVPAPFLQKGENEIIILELHDHKHSIKFVEQPVLG